jgi:ribosome assembly protein YihI (activator of Der GTPase)
LPKPQNLDIYLNRVDEGKTLGIPNEKFVASKSDSVVLLKPLETCTFSKKIISKD